MFNSLFWGEELRTKLSEVASTETLLDTGFLRNNMTAMIRLADGLIEDNLNGIQICKNFVAQAAVAAGKYAPNMEPVNICKLLQTKYASMANLSINIAPAVPQAILMDAYITTRILNAALGYVIHHDRTNGPMFLVTSVNQECEDAVLVLRLTNERPGDIGPQTVQVEAEELEIDAELPTSVDNNKYINQNEGVRPCLGSNDTRTGLPTDPLQDWKSDVKEMSKLISADSSFQLLDNCALFTLSFKLKAAQDCDDARRPLPEGMVFIGADDGENKQSNISTMLTLYIMADVAPRASYKG